MKALTLPVQAVAPPTGFARRWWRSPERTLHLLSLGSVAVLLLVWVFITETGIANELFLPGPGAVYDAFIKASVSGYQGSTLDEHLLTSLARIMSGFGLACIVGIPLGVVMGISARARATLNPMIEFYRPLPPLGLYSLLVMWLGIGETSKVALLFLAGLPGIVIATNMAVANISPIYVRAAQSLGASGKDLFLQVYLPAAGPTILTGMRISLGFVYTVLVAAEIVAATAGIGWMIWDASKFLLSDIVIMGLIVLGLTGVTLDLIMRLLGNALMPWSKKL
ncbi:ABC transporter permease [Allohahella marinimesophila]|uniref:ABC transporter permease subunit n=1 Tax=Allohahella marinimesophila TaxID=1054972 RepID=A0ABP7PFG7_9GAMM